MSEDTSEYLYRGPELGHTHDYLLPRLNRILADLPGKSIFEIGCGNGSVANYLSQYGYRVAGIDDSQSGIAQANRVYPHLRLEQGSAYDDLQQRYGQFAVVLSLEVIEHLYFPRRFARTVFDLLEPGGTAIISTPYHGYWKNLALALSGKLDAHFTALWDGGHIKFWSVKTLRCLLAEVGFQDIVFYKAGRMSILAKSMIAVARKP